MKKVNQIFICYPGGNMTAIVKDKVSRKLQSAVAQKILAVYNQGKPAAENIEQVAFEEIPTNKKAISRLQMGGGEFSGNAALCFAFLKLQKGQKGLLEISGAKQLLSASRRNSLTVCQMPLPKNINLKLSKEKFPIIYLEGIIQIIVNKFYDRNEDFQKKKALQIIKNNNLKSQLATGVLFIKKESKKIKMKPYVYFKKGLIYKIYKETACGSGSTALGINEFFLRKKPINKLEVIQPTKNIIFVSIKKINNQLQAWIKSKVKIIYQGSFNMEI